jgi:peptidase E
MTTQRFTLVGGGPGTVLALRRHFKAALAELSRPRPLLAYVGTATDDNRAFYTMIHGMMGATGARMKLARIASPKAKLSEARALLEDCDMVFVSGGDVEHGVKVLRDRDMVQPLASLARAGKPFFAISAGSLMLGREWVRFPHEDDESTAEIFPCLDLVPLHMDAHSEDDGWSELRVLMRLLHERGDVDPVGYGLTRKGALRVTIDQGKVEMTALGTPIPRFVVRGGKVAPGKPIERVSQGG